MNRNQRKYVPKKDERKDDKKFEIVEVFPPKNRRNDVNIHKSVTDRSCNISTHLMDRSQETEPIIISLLEYDNFQQYCLDPNIINTMKQLKDLRDILCRSGPKTEKSSQYMPPRKLSYILKDKSYRHRSDEVLSGAGKIKKRDINDIYITDTPRVKVVAERFSKIRKNNVEVRKMDEKIVCVEYDVFDKDHVERPVQNMRVYFSLKPETNEENIITTLPSIIKHQFNFIDDAHFNEKEIEILDDKDENRPYIQDLKKILKRNLTRKKESFDLKSLYEMARESRILNRNLSNVITKTELEEIKNLILNKRASSVHGLSRRSVKNNVKLERDRHISESLFAELLNND